MADIGKLAASKTDDSYKIERTTENIQMKHIATFILFFGTTVLLSRGQVQNKQSEKVASTLTDNKMSDIERLLNKTFPFIENYLREKGMFFPVASAVQTNDSIALVAAYDGNESPDPEKVIDDLKKSLTAHKDSYKTTAIFYAVTVQDPHTKVKTDAVAVFVETKGEDTAYIFYYPFSLPGKEQFAFSDRTWKIATSKEIFKD